MAARDKQGLPFINDDLSAHNRDAGRWSNPVQPDQMQEPASLPPSGFDYSAGVLVGVPGTEADAMPGVMHPVKLLRRTDVPNSYEVPHEATHRRFEPPFTVAVNQAAAGFSLLAPPKMGLHYLKVIAALLTLDAAGTLRFVQGSSDGLVIADLSGNMALGGANNGELTLAPADLSTPWFYASPDQALGVFTVTGKAQGFVTMCYSPYEA